MKSKSKPTETDMVQPEWRHLPHDADIGLLGIGPTKAEAFRQAALALTAVVTDLDRVEPVTTVEITCESPADDYLLLDWLNALIYEMAVRDMIFSDFKVEVTDGQLRASATGEIVDPDRHHPAVEVKGATMTDLAVTRIPGGWQAQCVVDV